MTMLVNTKNHNFITIAVCNILCIESQTYVLGSAWHISKKGSQYWKLASYWSLRQTRYIRHCLPFKRINLKLSFRGTIVSSTKPWKHDTISCLITITNGCAGFKISQLTIILRLSKLIPVKLKIWWAVK